MRFWEYSRHITSLEAHITTLQQQLTAAEARAAEATTERTQLIERIAELSRALEALDTGALALVETVAEEEGRGMKPQVTDDSSRRCFCGA